MPVLSGFGEFTADPVLGCFNDIAVVGEHPALSDFTEDNLSDWSCSVHNAFGTWPLEFEVVGLALHGSAYTAPGGQVGTPYILARGVDVRSDITISPMQAELPDHGVHELTASVR